MPKRQIFYSFHFANDAMRVQQIRNIGALEDNKPVSENQWEDIKRKGDDAIKRWIDDNMSYRSCVIVLIGTETAERKWVQYEIKKAWEDKKGLFGIYIHNLKCPKTGKCLKGPNPFDLFEFSDGTKLSSFITCYNPNPEDAYSDIRTHLESWVEKAIEDANNRW